MDTKRFEEIRAIIADIRIAEQTGEGRRHLWADAKHALLELLDAHRAGGRATNDELAQEAEQWDSGQRTPQGFVDAPEAVVRPNTYVAYLAESCRDGQWGFESLRFDPEDAADDIAGNGHCGRVCKVQFTFDPDETPEPVCCVEWEPGAEGKCEDCLAREEEEREDG